LEKKRHRDRATKPGRGKGKKPPERQKKGETGRGQRMSGTEGKGPEGKVPKGGKMKLGREKGIPVVVGNAAKMGLGNMENQ